jgi:hypothetical protein
MIHDQRSHNRQPERVTGAGVRTIRAFRTLRTGN